MKHGYGYGIFLLFVFSTSVNCSASEELPLGTDDWHLLRLRNPVEPEEEQLLIQLNGTDNSTPTEQSLNPHYCQLNHDYFQHRKSTGSTKKKIRDNNNRRIAQLGLIKSTGIVQRPPAQLQAVQATPAPTPLAEPTGTIVKISAPISPIMQPVFTQPPPPPAPARKAMPAAITETGLLQRINNRVKQALSPKPKNSKPKGIIAPDNHEPECRIS